MTETIACAVERFIAHKRAHGRKYHSEARELALLVRFAAEHHVSRLGELTPALLEDFLASRPRPHPRSFNHLLGVVRCLLDWAVTWGLLEASPLQAEFELTNDSASDEVASCLRRKVERLEVAPDQMVRAP